ncbi:MAG: GreA/GreB family elongation factor [Sandaracinus sp.]|nr:GreA/GreB family elongation factor [Sandaracinus sp.]
MTIDKRAVLAAAIAKLEEEHRALVAHAEATREEATHEEAKPENDKDTRAVEQSYLARGQAQRVEDMAESITRLRFMELPSFGPDDAIAAGALVEVELDDESTQRWFVVPVGGGMTVEQAGETIRLITPASPVGQALVGKFEGDDFEVRVQRKVRHYAVLSVC